MKDLSEVLRDIEYKTYRRNKNNLIGSRNIDLYFVIDDRSSKEEPQVYQQSLSEEMLARNNDYALTKDVLENSLMSAFKKWRGKSQ